MPCEQVHCRDARSMSCGKKFGSFPPKFVLKGGLGAGVGAYLPKGSTLKATTVVFSNEVCSTYIVMSSRTLFTVHVCVCVCVCIYTYIYMYIYIYIYLFVQRERDTADNLATFTCEENSGIKPAVRIITIKI